MRVALGPRAEGTSRLKPEGQSRQRLDIQGLRMVAVLLVFATHLFGWPRGGFMGVDVFFCYLWIPDHWKPSADG